MDWGGLLRTVVGAGLGTAAVQALIPIFRDMYQRRRDAAYLALRLAVALESYAAACADLLNENDNSIGKARAYLEEPDLNPRLPPPPPYPDDQNGWRAIPSDLASRCLGFPNKICWSQAQIGFCIENYPVDLPRVIDKEASERGLEAWTLAVELRRTYHLELADPGWGLPEALAAAQQKAIQADIEQRAQSTDFLGDMTDRSA